MLPNIKAYLRLEVYNYTVCSSTGWFEPYHFGIKNCSSPFENIFLHMLYEMQKRRIAAHPRMLVSALLFDAPIGLV